MSDKKNNHQDDNDTPFQKAVAIETRSAVGETSAPHIIAKGTGKLAEQILDIAFKKGVKVRQDKELTDLLEHFDVESPIPLEALDVVSDILRHVYIANGSLKPETGE